MSEKDKKTELLDEDKSDKRNFAKLRDKIPDDLLSDLGNKAENILNAASKIFSSPVFFRVLGVATAVAFFSAPVLVLGVSSLVIGTVVDTARVSFSRKYRKERGLLVKYINAKMEKDLLLKEVAPDLAGKLKTELCEASRKGKKSLEERYTIKNKKSASFSSIGEGLVTGASNLARNGLDLILSPSFVNAATFVRRITLIYDDTKEKISVEQFHQKQKAFINQLRESEFSPGYDDIEDLARQTKQLRVQKIALKKMIISGNYINAKDDHAVKSEFGFLTKVIHQSEKDVVSSRGFVAKTKLAFKNLRSSINPLSKYNNLDIMKFKEFSSLSNVAFANKGKDTKASVDYLDLDTGKKVQENKQKNYSSNISSHVDLEDVKRLRKLKPLVESDVNKVTRVSKSTSSVKAGVPIRNKKAVKNKTR